jgi:nitrite reductase/ring-hydroxylating ferredoxin subunit
VKRVAALSEVSRRDFCGLAALGIMGCAIGCTDGGTSAVQTGALGSDEPVDASHTTDGSTTGEHDAGVTSHDASTTSQHDAATTGATCTGSPTDVGAPSAFVLNTPTYFSSGGFFVVRDSGGLYALTAKCTHQGATVEVKSGEFYCPRHGATFNFDGGAPTSPASSALKHFAMCTLANGHVGVETATTVTQATRLDA